MASAPLLCLLVLGGLVIWSSWLVLVRVDIIQSLDSAGGILREERRVDVREGDAKTEESISRNRAKIAKNRTKIVYWQNSSMPRDCQVLRKTFKYAPECEGKEELRVYPLLITGTGRVGTKFASEAFKKAGFDLSHDNQRIGRLGAAAWPLAMRETGEMDRSLYNSGGYALPNFARALGSQFLGIAPSARFAFVLHQTRHPLATIASRADRIGMMYAPIAYSNPHLFKDVLHYAPSFPPPNELTAWYQDRSNAHEWNTDKRLRVALFHYVFFNEFVYAYADATYQVEYFDIDTIIHFAQLPSPAGRSVRRQIRLLLTRSRSRTLSAPERIKDTKHNKKPMPNHYALKHVNRNLSWTDLLRVSPFVASRARALAVSFGYDD